MKKRIESLSNLPKPQKYFYKANVFDNKKEKHLKHEYNKSKIETIIKEIHYKRLKMISHPKEIKRKGKRIKS